MLRCAALQFWLWCSPSHKLSHKSVGQNENVIRRGSIGKKWPYAVFRWERYQSVIWLPFMKTVSLRACNPSMTSMRKLIR